MAARDLVAEGTSNNVDALIEDAEKIYQWLCGTPQVQVPAVFEE